MNANMIADAAAAGEREVTAAEDRGTKSRAQRVSGTGRPRLVVTHRVSIGVGHGGRFIPRGAPLGPAGVREGGYGCSGSN